MFAQRFRFVFFTFLDVLTQTTLYVYMKMGHDLFSPPLANASSASCSNVKLCIVNALFAQL